MVHRIRASEFAIFAAFVVFCLAWFPLHFVADSPSVGQSASLAQFASLTHPDIAVALLTLNVAGLLGLVAVLAEGVYLVGTAVMHVVKLRRWGVAVLFVTALVVAVAYGAIALLLAPAANVSVLGGQQVSFSPHAGMVRIGLVLGGLLAFLTCITALVIALKRSDLSIHTVRLAIIPAGIAAAAVTIGVLAGITLIVLIALEAQHQLGTSPAIEGGLLIVLLCAAVLACASFWRGVEALRTPQPE